MQTPLKINSKPIPRGARYVTLYNIGTSLKNSGSNYEETLKALTKHNNVWCEIPLPQEQVRRIVKQVCREKAISKGGLYEFYS